MALKKEDPKKCKEFLDEAKAIVAKLSEDQQEAARRQIERVEVLWLLPAVENQSKSDLKTAKGYLDGVKKIVASMPEGQRWAYRDQVKHATLTWLLAAAEKGAAVAGERKEAKAHFDNAQKIVNGLPEAQRDAYREQIDRIAKLLNAAG